MISEYLNYDLQNLLETYKVSLLFKPFPEKCYTYYSKVLRHDNGGIIGSCGTYLLYVGV